MPNLPLLSLKNLTVHFKNSDNNVIKNLSLTLHQGQTLGLAGASGSGKSLTALALMGLLPAHSEQRGRIIFRGQDLTKNSPQQWQAIRGKHIGLVFQEPMTALNPVRIIVKQIDESIRLHSSLNKIQRHEKIKQLLHQVQLDTSLSNRYPHQLSGGQKQRVVIAMAMACQPDILICDEPTTALDVTTQKNLVVLLKQLQQTHGMAMLFISHDLAVMSQIADHIAIMQKGTVVEQAETATLMQNPKTDYTRRLIAAAAPENTLSNKITGRKPPLVAIKNLQVRFKQKANGFKSPAYLHAVDDVTLKIKAGDVVGLVGESGSGKTTLGRCLVGLQDYTNGQINIHGSPRNKHSHKSLQMIFQDPYASLNPRMTIQQSLSEPLDIHNLYRQPIKRQQRLNELLQQVDLNSDMLSRLPHQFSGGQRQRIAIARALACEPELLICDEAVTALDVLVQQQVVALLKRLVADTNLSLLFISHDIALVSSFANRLAVMQQGRLVEQGETSKIMQQPQHSYTQQLISSIPRLATTA